MLDVPAMIGPDVAEPPAPGALTRALLEGQRARYVSPVRLYLACSVLYFVLAAAAPVPGSENEFDISMGVSFSTGSGEQTAGEAAFGKAVTQGLQTLSAEERAALDAEIAEAPGMFQPILRAVATDDAGLRRRVSETIRVRCSS
jgi:hypothetical protein